MTTTLKNLIKNQYLHIVLFVFAFLCGRYFCYGIEYYYQLDDYVLYHNFPSSLDYWRLILEEGFLASRPLAGISDLYIWGQMFDVMFMGVIIISLMYAISSALFYRLFNKLFGTGKMFVVFYALMPFFFEGAYWMSAATRIVAGLFFISLSASFLYMFFEKGKKRFLAPFAIFQLVSFGLYEQILILSVTLSFLIILLYCKESKKPLLINLITLANGIIYLVVTNIYKAPEHTALARRMSIILPSNTEWYAIYIKDILAQLKTAFITAPTRILFRGFYRGIEIIIKDKLWLTAIVAIVLAYTFYNLYRKSEKSTEYSSAVKIIFSLCLTLAPISVFFVIANSYFGMRNILPSFVGIAILADMAVTALLSNHGRLNRILPVLFVAVCFISSISETNDYKKIYEFDVKFTKEIIKTEKNIEQGSKAAFLIRQQDEPIGNYRYHEHNAGAISTDWSLQGLHVYLKDAPQASLIPVEIDGNVYYQPWDKELKQISSFDSIYYWDNVREEFIKLERKEISKDYYELYFDQSDIKFASVKEHKDTGYIFIE